MTNVPENLEQVPIPYVLKDRILMSPGVWNNYIYSPDVIARAFKKTEWNKQNRALFLDHVDDRAADWIGEVDNLRMENNNLVGDVVIVDKPTAMKIAYGAKFGISPKIVGDADNNRRISDFVFENFSIVINPAVKTTFLNAEIKNKGDRTMPEEIVEVASEDKLEQSMSEMVKLLKEIKESLEKQKEEMAKKKEQYPYPEEQCKDKMSEVDEVLESLKEFPNSEWTDFVAKYIKEHKGEAPVKDLMKKAAEEYKKKYPEPYKENVEVVDLDKKLSEVVPKIIEQKFSELGVNEGGIRIAQKFIDPAVQVDSEELDLAMFDMMRGVAK